MTWHQPICQPCQPRHAPDRVAVRISNAHPRICCFCGEAATSGLTIRIDPASVSYPSED